MPLIHRVPRQSSLLSQSLFVHGFTTRQMGDMRTKEARNRLLTAADYGFTDIQTVKQVHGTAVAVITKETRSVVTSDGMVTSVPGILLCVQVADCIPILFADPVAHLVGAVHAGWKGTVGNIVERTVSVLRSHGSSPENLLVAIGPHIGGCCYTVSDERAALFATHASHWGNAWHVDLGSSVREQLVAAGIKEHHIDWSVACTSCQNDEYYSYRRDAKETFGEIAGYIGISV